jgi:hypothetical protein
VWRECGLTTIKRDATTFDGRVRVADLSRSIVQRPRLYLRYGGTVVTLRRGFPLGRGPGQFGWCDDANGRGELIVHRGGDALLSRR